MNRYLLIIILCLLCLLACENKADITKKCILTVNPTEIVFEYTDSTITFSGAIGSPAKWILRDNQYFNEWDSSLVLTLKDTVVYYNSPSGEKYMNEFQKIGENSFRSISSEITYQECAKSMLRAPWNEGAIVLSVFYYDSTFQITKIAYRLPIEYTLE